MKQIFKPLQIIFITLFVLGFSSCTKETDPAPSIVGKWIMQKMTGDMTVLGQKETMNEDYTKDNYYYNFKSDGTFEANGSIDVDGTVSSEVVTGKYVITNNEIKLTYREKGATTDTIEYYKLGTLNATDLVLTIDKALLTKMSAEIKDPNILLIIGFITDININLSFKKSL